MSRKLTSDDPRLCPVLRIEQEIQLKLANGNGDTPDLRKFAPGSSAEDLRNRVMILEEMVEPDGIEPTTSSMPLKRSPN